MSPRRLRSRLHHARRVLRGDQHNIHTDKYQTKYERSRKAGVHYATPKERALKRASHFLADNAEQHSIQRTDATVAWRETPKDTQPSNDKESPQPDYNKLRELLSNDPIVITVAMPAFALMVLMTVLMFWRGHQLPGGGFVAGALIVCALLLYRIAEHRSAVQINFTQLIPVGVSIAFTTGIVPYLLGKGFLNSDYGYITTYITGKFEWASAMLFDLGVFLTVLGGAMTIAESLINITPQELTEDDN